MCSSFSSFATAMFILDIYEFKAVLNSDKTVVETDSLGNANFWVSVILIIDITYTLHLSLK